MSSLNIEYNGASIPIANIGVVSSKQKVILGNLQRDLVLQTAGSISIQVGNRYYDLSFSSNGQSNAITSNVNFIDSILGTSFSNYEDGAFVFASDSKSLYIIYSGKAILLAAGGGSSKMFLSFSEDQELTGNQKKQLLLNTESIIDSIDDVKKFTKNKVYDGYIIFVNDENQHYILSDINNPELKQSWSTFYIGSNGGIINNGLVIKNKTRENLLYLNGIDDYNSLIFNGLKIGGDNSNIKISVTNDDISLLKTNSKYFKLYNNSNLILSSNNGNIGIGGNPSGSDKYKILFTGNAKFDDYIYTDNRILSSDYTSTNVTHWDGGKGFALIKDTSGNWFMEVDDLIVRNSLTANLLTLKELKVERTYATGGHMIVTDGSIVDTMYLRKPTTEELNTANVANNGYFGTLDSNSYYYFVTFKNSKNKDDNNAYVNLDSNPQDKSINGSTVQDDVLDEDSVCPFIYGDVLLCQNVLGVNAKRYYCKVSYSTNNYIAIKESDFRNNKIYQHDTNGDPISVIKEYLIEKGDELVRITNISVDSEGKYKYDTRRRFIDIDGTRNQITMYDKMGNSNLFSVDNLVTTTSGFKYYPNINVVTGIKDGENQGALKLRIGRLDDLGINGLSGYGLYADNVYLKGKLIVKNDDIETFVGANRGTWLSDNTNTYYINDLVTFGGSVYRCITKHTNTQESKAIPGISNFWEIFVKKGDDGIAGNLFRYVELSGEQVFVFNNDTQSFEKSLIPLTCTAFNVDYKNLTSLRFDWKIGESSIYSKTYKSSELSSTTIADSLDIYAQGTNNEINWDNYWNDNKTLTVRCLLFVDSSETYDSDTFSLYKIYSATPNYTWIRYSQNSDGVPMQNDPAGMKYIGIAVNKVNPTESDIATDYTWSLIKGIDGSFVTFAYTASTLRPDKPTGTPANPGTPWVLNTPTVSDSAKYIWMSQVQTAQDGFVGEWSQALRITGEDGVAGDDGKSIEFIFKLSNETSLPTPESVNSDGYVPDGWTNISSGISESYIYEYVSTRVKLGDTWSNFSTPSIWSKWGQKGQDGAGVEYIYARTNEKIISDLPAITNDPNSPEHIPDGWSDEPLGVTEVIKYEWVSMRKKPEGASQWGNFSTPAIWAKWGKDGGDSLTGVLTNDSATVIADSNGLVSDYSPASGVFTTYFGTNQLTSQTIFNVLQQNNCVGTINESTGAYSISSLTADSGNLVLSGKYTTVGGTEMTITKVFSISKTKTGADGSPAVMYSIEPTTYAISKSSTSIYSPSSVTFNFYKITGTLKESYSGYFKTSYYNGTSWNYLITNGNGSNSGAMNPFTGYKIMRCELYSDSGYSNLVDSQTVIIVSDGADGVSAGMVQISGEQVFKYKKGSSTPENSTITLTASTQNISPTIYYLWSYYNVYSGQWVALTEYSASLSSYTFNVNLMTYMEATSVDHSVIRIRCSANGYTDETTLIKIYDGSDSYNVILTNESHTIACNSAGAAKSGELGSSGKAITRIIVYKGLNQISYGTGGWSYGTITDSNVTHNISSGQLYIETISADSGYVDIPIVVNGITIVTKRFSLSKSKDGIDGDFGVLGMLTNDSVTLIADSSGVVSDFSNATGTFKMYYGSSDVTTLSTFQKDVEKSVGCVGTINASTGVYSVSGFSNGYNSGYLTLTGTYSGITITRVFSVSKAIAGISGTSPTVYSINPSANTIVKSNTGTYSPSSVVFNFYKTTGSGSPTSFNSGSAKVYISSDGNLFTTQDSKDSVSSITGTPNSSTKYIKCDLFSDKNYTTLVDSQTILVVSDGSPGNNGSDAYTAFFTNESINIPALNNGQIPSSVLSNYNFVTKAIVYSGSNKATYNATTGYGYTITQISGSPITTTISGPNSDGLAEIKITGVTQTETNNVYSPQVASSDFTIVIKKNNVTIATLTKTLYISASKQGESALALKWISTWDGQSTSISSDGVATPRIFAGTKTGNNITGVMIGANVFGLTETGIAGYYYNGASNIKTFHLNAVDGSFQFGTGNSSIIYTPSTNSLTLGSNITMSWSNITNVNQVLTTIGSTGIYTGTLTAAQVNAVAINASSITTGTLSANRINVDDLIIKRIQVSKSDYLQRFYITDSGIGLFKNKEEENNIDKAIIKIGKDVTSMQSIGERKPGIVATDIQWRGPYDSSKTYYKDDRVYYNNATYIFVNDWSLENPSPGHTPPSYYDDFWRQLSLGNAKGGSYSEFSSEGFFSNGSNITAIPVYSGTQSNATGAFLLFKDNNSSSGLSAAIIGIDQVAQNPSYWNTSTTYDVDKIVYYNGSLYRCIVQNINKVPTNTTYWSDTQKSRTYGGYFVRLRADGWLPCVNTISTNYTISKTDFRIHCYNSSTITLTLPIPTNSDLGLMYEIRAMYASDVIVNAPNSYYPLWYERSKTSHTIGDYDCITLVWDGLYWVINTMGQ